MRRGKGRALIARYRSLGDPEVRRQLGHMTAEGVAALIAAIDSGIPMHELAWCPALLDSERGRALVRGLERSGMPTERVDSDTFTALSLQPQPSGVAMILQQPWKPLARLPTGATPVHLAVRRVRHPGNLGTLLRTMEAVDGGALLVLGPGVDPFGPDVLRGSMGSALRRPMARVSDSALRSWAQRRGLRIVGASPGAGMPHDSAAPMHPLQGPVVLVLGEERQGLGPEDTALCDAFVHLPIRGRIDSLNLGVAGSLLLYEVLRRCTAATSPCGASCRRHSVRIGAERIRPVASRLAGLAEQHSCIADDARRQAADDADCGFDQQHAEHAFDRGRAGIGPQFIVGMHWTGHQPGNGFHDRATAAAKSYPESQDDTANPRSIVHGAPQRVGPSRVAAVRPWAVRRIPHVDPRSDLSVDPAAAADCGPMGR